MSLFGIYRGICTTNSDPEGLSRIRLLIPQVLGKSESPWAWPCMPPGWFSNLQENHVFTDNDTGDNAGGSATETLIHTLRQKTPAVGEATWVMFEAGDREKPVWMGIWRTLNG